MESKEITLLKNARIYTCNEEMPLAEAVAFAGDEIVYVGTAEGAPACGEVFNLGGKTVLPGIIDSHIHPGMVSQSSWHIRLPWTRDLDEILNFIKEYAEKHPKEEIPFLYFEYYPTDLFGSKGPHKKYLDAVVSDRPVFCQDFGEHQHWINSAMLEAMGVTKETPDPIPGLQEFVRDENGEPTGWCKELVCSREEFTEPLFRSIGWEPPITMTPELMTAFFSFLSDHGITAIGDGLIEGEEQLASMAQLDAGGKLNVYYDGVVRFDSLQELPEKILLCKKYQEKYGDRHLRIRTMKLFLDGTNETGNSASLHPHRNDPAGENYGEIAMSEEDLYQCFLLCNEAGLDLHIHMVGDRAFRVGCNAVERAQEECRRRGIPWTCQPIFAHCEIVDPEDMPRPARLGITINWSCHWSGGYFGEEARTFFSDEKWERMYQFNPIIDSGALFACSSDVVTFYELHRADPFFGMQVAATRVDPEFPLDESRYPGSVRPPASARLSVETLLKGYTLNGAKQLRREGELGTIEAGKKANLCVISEDLFQVPPEQLARIRWEAVIFDGKLIRGRL